MYRIPRKNLIMDTHIPPENPLKSNQISNQESANFQNNFVSNLSKEGKFNQIQKVSFELLSKLVTTGQKIARKHERERKKRRKLRLARKLKKLKLLEKNKQAKSARKALFGPSAEDQQKLDFKEQEHAFKFIAMQTEWAGMKTLHRAATEFRLMSHTVDMFGNNFYQKMDHLEISLMDYFGMEHEHVEELEHELEDDEAHQALLDQEEDNHLNEEELLKAREDQLKKQQEQLEMEERMEKDIQELKHMDVLEDPDSPVSQENMERVNVQLAGIQSSVQSLKHEVDEHQENENRLKQEMREKIKEIDHQEGEDVASQVDDEQSPQNEDTETVKKSAIEGQVESLQQQIRAMQHQLGLMHTKQGKIEEKLKDGDSENQDD